MGKLKIVFRQSASIDLEEIWFYTHANWSIEQADRYISLIFNEIEFLAHNPTAGKSQEHIREGYRSSKVKSHYIYYRVTLSEIEIVRVLHENMDIPSRLND